ncbi:tubulin epsilon and delta complex protein 2 isoform X2 [Protopterus annectens]|uniref:tubulin epsilon and delta complex protein 2 isoform X2 n=1 Tax=Protopterus annectens TaxID=7888 RepID=UPI001CF9AFA8|nr:tubulin epsilon and delta complex protein 2 isoform X2 [Protopterus annectens]
MFSNGFWAAFRHSGTSQVSVGCGPADSNNDEYGGMETVPFSSPRLTHWLQQSITETVAEEQKLEEDFALCRKLLGPWKLKFPENPPEDPSGSIAQGGGPAPCELQELEILNKALEKALKVRSAAQGNKDDVLQKKIKGTADSTEPCSSSSHCVPTCHKIVKSITEPPLSRERQRKLVASKCDTLKKQPQSLLNPPYRTDPVARKINCTATVSWSANGTRGAEKSNAMVGVSHHPRISVSASRSVLKPQQRSRTGKQTDVTQPVPPGPSVLLLSSEGAEDQTEHFCSEQQCSYSCFSLNCKQANLVKNGDAVHDSGKPEKQSSIFTLQEDGTSLRLPPAYRREYIKNMSLWEKVQLCQKNAASEALCFIERLQSTPGLPAHSPMEAEMQIDQIHSLYSSVKQSLGKISLSYADSLPWDKEYERVLILENYYSFVSYLLQQLHKLKNVADFSVKVCPSDSIRKVSQKCRKHNGLVPELLLYSTSQELREIAALNQNIQILEQKVELQKALTDELLPYFQTGLPHVTDLPVFYRAIYSLLCERGRHFPVLIIDDIPE